MNAAGLAGVSRRKWMVTTVRDQNDGASARSDRTQLCCTGA